MTETATQNGATEIVVAPQPVDVRRIAQGEEITIQTFDDRMVMASIQAVSELVPGASAGSDLERAAFLAKCERLKTDPFSRMVHYMKVGNDPVAFVVSYMLYHERAAKHPMYDGYDSGIIWLVGGKTERGKVCDHKVGPAAEIIGGWAKVYRKDRKHPVDVEVPWSEAAKRKRDGTLTKNWSVQPTTMMVKVAESRALRKAFPDYFEGTYTDAEPISPPDDTESTANVLPRDEREPEPDAEAPVEPEPETPVKILGRRVIEMILAELPLLGEVPRDLTKAVLMKAAARATTRPIEEFGTTGAWTDKLVVSVNTMLDEFGIDPEWLPESRDAITEEEEDRNGNGD